MKGLLIRAPWIDLIFQGEKTWEIRGTNTKKRGTIALIKSGTGTILGTVELVAAKKLSIEEYQNSKKFHGVADCSVLPYKNTYAWVFENPVLFEEPKPYSHPMGAVIWVNLTEAGIETVQ